MENRGEEKDWGPLWTLYLFQSRGKGVHKTEKQTGTVASLFHPASLLSAVRRLEYLPVDPVYGLGEIK